MWYEVAYAFGCREGGRWQESGGTDRVVTGGVCGVVMERYIGSEGRMRGVVGKDELNERRTETGPNGGKMLR